MAGRWRIISHEHREWIITAGLARCAVRPDLGRALLPLAGAQPGPLEIIGQLERARWSEDRSELVQVARGLASILGGDEAENGPRMKERYSRAGITPGGRPIWLKVDLMPAAWTSWLAERLHWLAGWPQLTGLAGGGLAMYWMGSGGALPSLVQGLPRAELGASLGWAMGLFFITGVWHELGHAAALRKEGYAPGPIGLGLLFVIPVLYADVTPMVALPRSGRLRVGAAGVCFQIFLGGMLLWVGAGQSILAMAAWLALAAVLWSLLPFIRADGYWLLADALHLADLQAPVPPQRSTWLRLFLVSHRFLNGAFLVLVGVVFPWRIYGFLALILGRVGVSAWVVGSAVAVLAVLAWWGMGKRLLMLMKASWVDIKNLNPR